MKTIPFFATPRAIELGLRRLFCLTLPLGAFLTIAAPGAFSQSPSPAPQFEGSFDKLEIESLGGWAWDGSRRNAAIKVEIYDGTTLLSTITAQEFREDLRGAGKGDGRHAFNYALPRTLRDGLSHTISVRYAGTPLELPGSPKTLLFPKS